MLVAVDLVIARSTATASLGATMYASPPLCAGMLLRVTALRRRRRDERGASAVEYGLLVAGIAAVIVAVVFALRPGRLLEPVPETCNSIGQNMGGDC